jgi:hypothetical protein
VPVVFLAAVAAATAYLLRSRRREKPAGALGAFSATGNRSYPVAQPQLVGIRGRLLLYAVGLAAELAHGLALTIGSLVIYTKPSLVGLQSFIPL